MEKELMCHERIDKIWKESKTYQAIKNETRPEMLIEIAKIEKEHKEAIERLNTMSPRDSEKWAKDYVKKNKS